MANRWARVQRKLRQVPMRMAFVLVSVVVLVVFAQRKTYVEDFGEQGKIIEYYEGQRCESWFMFPGQNLWNKTFLGILYFLSLGYAFLGVAIVSDLFMEAIEKITSKTRTVRRKNRETGEEEMLTVEFWNPTVANLSLMALGSSAPEIMLAVLETLQTLDSTPGELGPSTIVGSAAFNLLAITAVCMMAIPDGQLRRISQFGVFLITAFCSVFAYFWMIVVLQLWTPNEVTVGEAVLTFLFFPILLVAAYLQDARSRKKKTKTLEGKEIDDAELDDLEEVEETEEERGYRVLGITSTTRDKENHETELVANKKDVTALMRRVKAELMAHNKANGIDREPTAEEIAERIMLENMPDPQQGASRMVYRVNAVRGLSGKRRVLPTRVHSDEHDMDDNDQEKASPEARAAAVTANNQIELESVRAMSSSRLAEEGVCEFLFAAPTYSCLENCGTIELTVERRGLDSFEASVNYKTIDGTATAGDDYVPAQGTLHFGKGETEKTVEIEIVDDNQYEPDETFLVQLSSPSEHARLHSKLHMTEVTIIDDDEPGVLGFEKATYQVLESAGYVELTVTRTKGSDGEVRCGYFTKDGTAEAGLDYEDTVGELVFEHGETSQTIRVAIIDDDEYEDDETFDVFLTDPKGGAKLSLKLRTATVTILDDDGVNQVATKLSALMKQRVHAFKMTSTSWAEQFHDAMTIEGEVDEFGHDLPPSSVDYVMHFLTMFWKVFFALIPPTDYWGGWLTFWVSLAFIGLVTAVVGELASLFGCTVGLLDSVTAITFVALGTSLPDTFASKQAATEAPDADAAVGNVTGSNSVNVFLGLGLPWLIASIYHASKGTKYVVPAGSLSYSVTVFTLCAFAAIALLLYRRKYVGGELGGSFSGKVASALFLVTLWLVYVLMSALQAYGLA